MQPPPSPPATTTTETAAGVSGQSEPPAPTNAPSSPKDPLREELATLGVASREPVRAALANALSAAGTQEAAAPPAPAEPKIKQLYRDPAFAALYNFAIARVQHVERSHTEWDKLGQAKSFAAAVSFVTRGTPLDGKSFDTAPLFSRFKGDMERRAICHLLLLLMPPHDRSERPLRNDGSRGAPQDLFRPFPDALIERSDDGFRLRPGDLPKIAPIFTEHLQGDVVDKIFKKGQRGLFLASKSYCPGAFLQDRKDINPPSLSKLKQSGHEGDPIFVTIDDIVDVDGVRMAKVRVPAQHKVWLWDNGSCVRGEQVLPELSTVVDKDGKDTGEPILIPVEHLADYLLKTGDGAPRLDFSRPDERAVALAFAHTLKSTWHKDRNGISKTLFDWLEQADARTPRADVEIIREKVREAAFQSVVRYSTHPRRTHWRLVVDPNRNDWQKEARRRCSTGCRRRSSSRSASSPPRASPRGTAPPCSACSASRTKTASSKRACR
jgi:hypothetical protein